MPQVALAVICRNSSGTLGRLLESLAAGKAVQAVYAVDTGSTDSTVPLLESWGAAVGRITWPDDYAEARNAVLAMVPEGWWVLSLDSDEWVAPGFGDRLQAHLGKLEADKASHRGVSVRVLNSTDAMGFENIMPMFAPRIFRKLPNTEWRYPVHEQVFRRGADGAWDYLQFSMEPDLVVYHDGYLASAVLAFDKLERNRRLLLKGMEQYPAEAWFKHHYAETLYALGEPAEALEWYQRAADQFIEQGLGNMMVAASTRMRIAELLAASGDLPSAVVVADRLVQDHPNYAEGVAAAGVVYNQLGKFYEAGSLFERAVAIGDLVRQGAAYPYSGDDSLRGWRSALVAGRCMAMAKEYVRAVEWYLASESYSCPVVDPMVESAACFAHLGRRDLAYARLDEADKKFPGQLRVLNVRILLDNEGGAGAPSVASVAAEGVGSSAQASG